MIVPMKKYTFLVYHRHYTAFLQQLRETGVLHVKERKDVNLAENEDLRQRLEEGRRLTAVIRQLQALAPAEGVFAPIDQSLDGMAALKHIEDLFQQRSDLQLKQQSLQKEIDGMLPWGNFDWQQIRQLQQAGCRLDFFTCNKSAFKSQWEKEYRAVIVGETSAALYFVTFSLDGQRPEIEADQARLSASSLGELQERMAALESELKALDAELADLSLSQLRSLEYAACQVNDNYEFSKVLCETQHAADDRLRVLEGFVPEDKEVELLALMEQSPVWYQAEKASVEAAEVPIKLKNGRFARLFEPLTKLYSLPNYGELDPTPAFAPFFTLFFGLCLGDGGYGLVVLLASTWAKHKLPQLKSYAIMGQWLGLSTILVGLLTGMVFGISLDTVAWPWLANVKHMFVTDNNYSIMGYSPMMVFAICIGFLQILFAMGFKVVRISTQIGFKYALSDLGWLVLLIDLLVYLVLMLAKVPVPQIATYVIFGLAGCCAVLIFFFNSPGKNPFIQFGSGLWGTYNMVSGLLGDVLSYIRLFALGLAGGILGSVFNSLAFQAGGGLPVWIGWLPTAIILLFGHGLNFFLCIISSIVHPLRLTYVEFFKNCGYEGGGKEYQPFRRTAVAEEPAQN